MSTLEEAIAGAPPVTIPLRPTWIRHRVLPRERVTQIAVRYGVTPPGAIPGGAESLTGGPYLVEIVRLGEYPNVTVSRKSFNAP